MEIARKKIEDLRREMLVVWQKLGMDVMLEEREELEREVAEPEIWQKPEVAREKNERLARVNERVEPWVLLRTQIEDIVELIELGDEELLAEILEQVEALAENLTELRKGLWFLGEYDGAGAIVRITAGAGGVEAMDWAGMLERMYLRFFEKRGYAVSCLERVAGEEAGIKTAVYEVVAGARSEALNNNIYGWMRSEHGVHRLVRLSPFNADNLRQTSFALVEVLPILPEVGDLVIEEKDLRVDVYRSGGHGGQSVNTTDSAVRITHLPTGIVVAIQNERSQIQNREKAMEILRGRLVQLKQEQQVASIGELRAGESAGWGQQIRNYVMQPYQLVKDTRTKYEEGEVGRVLDGEIRGFMEAWLDRGR